MISIIIPTYNEEKNIEECLSCLEKQTISRDKYEIIIVDGRSKDNTVKIAKKYADKVIMQKGKGVGGARNDGIKIAAGDIIATTDADCIVPENWVEQIMHDFENKDIVMLYGPLKSLEQKKRYEILMTTSSKISWLIHNTGIFYPTVGANTAFKKDAFFSIGGYNEELGTADDYEMTLRIKKKGKVLFDDNLYVSFSMRRLEKYGLLRTTTDCIFYPIKLMLRIKIKNKNYCMIDYN